MIVMDSKAQLTVDIIAKVVEGRITIANAAKLLGKSRRTIERYVKQYQQVGIQFAIHGNSVSNGMDSSSTWTIVLFLVNMVMVSY